MNKTKRHPLRGCRSILFSLGLAVAALILSQGALVGAAPSPPVCLPIHSGAFQVAQENPGNTGTDEGEVSPDQVDKYVAVYKAMHRDRSLTAEQAAAAQGMTLRDFRELENRIQRDDSALQHARDELQAAAQTPSPVPSAQPGGAAHSQPTQGP